MRAYWPSRPSQRDDDIRVAKGVPAIEQMLYEGYNINVTLLFAVEAYEAVAEVYIRALERRRKKGRRSEVNSVASFFVFVHTQPNEGSRKKRPDR